MSSLMNCKDCGKEYTPLTCPACGGALDGGSCPACSEGSRVTCTNCGQQLEIARVDAEMSEGLSPDGARPGEIERPEAGPHHPLGGLFGGGAETQAPALADIEVAANHLPPQPERATPLENLERAMEAGAPPPPGALPETMSGEAADLSSATSVADVPVPGWPGRPVPPAYQPPERHSGAPQSDASPDGPAVIPPSPFPAGENAAPQPPPAYTPPPTQAAPGGAPQQPYQPPRQDGYAPPAYGQQAAYPPSAGGGQPAGGYPQQPPQQPYGYPAYGQQPPGGGWQPYPGQPYARPLHKAPLGGWMTAYFVFVIIGLAFSCIDLVNSLTSYSPSVVSIIISAVLYILPAVMIIVCIARRDLNFRKWFVFRAVIGFITSGLLLLMAVAVGVMSSMGELSYYLDELLYDLIPYGMSGFDFYGAVMGVVMAMLIIMAVVQVAWYVAWLIYFRRSRQVAWAFDPRNNPPR